MSLAIKYASQSLIAIINTINKVQPLFWSPLAVHWEGECLVLFVSYYIVPSYSPWAFATADSLSFEIHGDGVNARVRWPHRLQGPAKFNRGRRAEFRNNKKKRSTRTLGDTVLQRNTKNFFFWIGTNVIRLKSALWEDAQSIWGTHKQFLKPPKVPALIFWHLDLKRSVGK